MFIRESYKGSFLWKHNIKYTKHKRILKQSKLHLSWRQGWSKKLQTITMDEECVEMKKMFNLNESDV